MNILQKHRIAQSVVTPSVKQAVINYKYAFYYLYPGIFKIDVDSNGLVFLKALPFTRKHIPWLLSIILVSGECGGGCCLYTFGVQLTGTQRMPWIQWSLFNTMITSGLFFAVTLEIFCYFILYNNSSTAFPAFNQLVRLEQKCNLNY